MTSSFQEDVRYVAENFSTRSNDAHDKGGQHIDRIKSHLIDFLLLPENQHHAIVKFTRPKVEDRCMSLKAFVTTQEGEKFEAVVVIDNLGGMYAPFSTIPLPYSDC